MDSNPKSTNSAAKQAATTLSQNTTTTVIVRSENSRVITNGTLIGTLISNGSQPSLTIQVNQDVDYNNSAIINNGNDANNKNNSVSVVNSYRAIPAQIDDSCINDINELSNNNELNLTSENVDNLDAIKVDTSDHNKHINVISTEAQNDNHQTQTGIENKPIIPSQNDYVTREHRRRERRERRQSRRPPPPIHSHSQHHHQPIPLSNISQTHNNINSHPMHFHPHHNIPLHAIQPPFEILPDLLNSHYPPPYSTLPAVTGPIVPSIVSSAVNVGSPEDIRYAFSIPVIRR